MSNEVNIDKANIKKETGLIHIYHGDGKGKTSASVGAAIRMAGSGAKVLFGQFLKDNKSNELNILTNIENIDVVLCEKIFGFVFAMSEEEKREAREVCEEYLAKLVDKVDSGNYKMVVIDELIDAYNLGMVPCEKVLGFLKSKRTDLEVVLTGRNPSAEMLELADYVTEMKKGKHPYDKGVGARDGVER